MESSGIDSSNIRKALDVLYESQSTQNLSTQQINDTTEAIKTLALSNFQLMPMEIFEKLQKLDLSGLIVKIKDKLTTAEDNQKFSTIMMLLAKQLEKQAGTPFVDQTYHGDVIKRAINLLTEKMREGRVDLNLRDFARQYSTDLLKSSATAEQPKKYLLRDSSSVANTKDREYFVISRVEKQADQNLIGHQLIIRVKNEKGEYTWHKADDNFNPLAESFPNSRTLVVKIYPGYEAVPVPGDRQLGTYVAAYVEATSKKIDMNEDAIIKNLIDPISLDRFRVPVIAPSGHTFSREAIIDWLTINTTDPLTKTVLAPHMLKTNHLVALILRTRIDQWEQVKHTLVTKIEDWKRDPILQLFEDPISHELITEPVLASDGITYDKNTLIDYLKSHDNQLPAGGGPCTEPELIPNRVAKEILEERKKKFA